MPSLSLVPSGAVGEPCISVNHVFWHCRPLPVISAPMMERAGWQLVKARSDALAYMTLPALSEKVQFSKTLLELLRRNIGPVLVWPMAGERQALGKMVGR